MMERVAGADKVHATYIATSFTATVLQYFALARLPGAELGYVILGISATQGILQIGDLGQAVTYIDRVRGSEMNAAALFWQVVVVASMAVAAVESANLLHLIGRPEATCIALGIAGGAAVSADRFRSIEASLRGDLVRSYSQLTIWTNSPKLGLITGALAWRRAYPALLLGLGTSALSLLKPPRLTLDGLKSLRDVWAHLPGMGCVTTSWLIGWLDVYILTACRGLAVGGIYGFASRAVQATFYLYAPVDSMTVALVKDQGWSGYRRPMKRGVALAAMGAACYLLVALALKGRVRALAGLPVSALACLAVTPLMNVLAMISGSALKVQGAAAWVAASGFVTVAFEAVAGLLIIPRYSITGASITLLSTCVLSALSQVAIADRRARKEHEFLNPT